MQKGFFKSLFDLSFTSFVTPKIIKVLYVILLVLLSLAYVGIGIALFTSGSSSLEYNSVTGQLESSSGGSVTAGLLWFFIGGPILLLIYAVLYRIMLEFIIVVFRIYENSRDAVALMRAQWPEASAAVGFTPGIGGVHAVPAAMPQQAPTQTMPGGQAPPAAPLTPPAPPAPPTPPTPPAGGPPTPPAP